MGFVPGLSLFPGPGLSGEGWLCRQEMSPLEAVRGYLRVRNCPQLVSALCSFIFGITQIADFNGAVRERGNSSSRFVQGSVLVVSGCSERSFGDKLTPGLEEPSCGPAVQLPLVGVGD